MNAEQDTIAFDGPPTDDEKRALCRGKHYTLDGAPARVSGAMLPFAHVSRLDGRGGVVEFAWETVRHIDLNRGGRFQS